MKIVERCKCLFRGHVFFRVPLDRTMKQTTRTVIKCVYCEKRRPDTHLDLTGDV